MCKNIEMRAVSTFYNDNSETIEYSVAYLSWGSQIMAPTAISHQGKERVETLLVLPINN